MTKQRTFAALPEPVNHRIGPFPGKLPCRVKFSIRNDGLREKAVTNEQQARKSIRQRAVSKLSYRFLEKSYWVDAHGVLHDEAPSKEDARDLDRNPVVDFSIDFGFFNTEHGAIYLPEKIDPSLREIDTGYALEIWKLCLTRSATPEYHDHVLFENGRFFLHSVHLAREEAAK
ncbi:MAG TPA: hypothetical protein VFT82_03095 [Candidatus Paceibacterota bacterium]|nr:hypothetical protein [Candidatus Paceibacterota bacterium]